MATSGGDIRTISFVSLGCPKNLVDSEKMLALLAQDGLIPVPQLDPDGVTPADAIVVNTCGFLEASKDESLRVLEQAIAHKHRGDAKRIIVAGCLVQRHRAKMLEWAPGIDALIGVFDRDRIVDAVRGSPARESPASPGPSYWIAANALQAANDRGMETTGLTVNGKDGRGLGYWEDDSARIRLTPRHYAYLRVSEGCNQNCAFCTIPSIRGKMRSKPLDAIAREARELLADGAFELLLIGQDTTSYGDDIGIGHDGLGRGGLPDLLRTISTATREAIGPSGRAWIRLMYAYPSTFTRPMIDAFAELAAGVAEGRPGSGGLIPYIDIPLQHASDRILSAMRRNVSAARQRDLIAELRERIPGLAIRTTLIAGFPGETEADHAQVLDFVRSSRFEALGVFEYSREDGTPAGRLDLDPALAIPAHVKARRREEIMLAQQEVAFAHAAAREGETHDIIIDAQLRSTGRATSGVGKGGKLYQGRAYFQAPQIDACTFVQSREALAPGELIRCRITGSDGYDLIAAPAADADKRTSLPIARA